MKMKLFIASALVSMGLLTGCGPYEQEISEEIKNNETGFVVPLEGNTYAKQGQFMSIEYLEKSKIASKRIIIPQRQRSTGRMWYNYEWIPTVRVIKVDRSPQTREWKEKNGISVESKDSVGFTVGVNLTAMIKEEDAARFLYYYPNSSLQDVMNNNIRGYIQNVLSRDFGSRMLTDAIANKAQIVDALSESAKKHFIEFGITIATLGLADGISFDNTEVQKTIDSVFVNATVVLQSQQKKEAQKILNETELSIAQNERAKAEEFAKASKAQTEMIDLKIKMIQAEAMLESAKRWDGKVPASVVPSGSPFLFQFKGESK